MDKLLSTVFQTYVSSGTIGDTETLVSQCHQIYFQRSTARSQKHPAHLYIAHMVLLCCFCLLTQHIVNDSSALMSVNYVQW